MASVRLMTARDLPYFDRCNLDPLTETFNVGFYLEYLSKWPHLCAVIENHKGQIDGYSTRKILRHQQSNYKLLI